MLRVIGRRLLVAVPMLFIIASLTFFLMALVPGDAASTMLGANATPAQYEALRHQLGLDQPILVQYANWMGGLFTGDFGVSLRSGRPVLATLAAEMPVTLSVALLASVVTMILGVVIGLASAVGRRGFGRIAQFGAIVGTSLPNFWIALVLVVIFSVTLRVLPATGYISFAQSPIGWLTSLVLPVAAIAIAGVSDIARQTRSAMIDVMSEDFVRTLLAAGTPRSVVLYKHVLRNAAIPVVTTFSFLFISLLGGAVIIEQVFALPGLGQGMVGAIAGRDVPLVQGIVVLTAAFVIAANLLVDLLMAWLNPKARVA